MLYPAKLFFLIKGEIRTFQGKHNLMQFMTTKVALQKILTEILYTEEEERWSQLQDQRE